MSCEGYKKERRVGLRPKSVKPMLDVDARLDEVDARLRELELRLRHDLTLRMGGMIAAGVALIAALELLSR